MFDNYKKITLDDMMKYIDENAAEDKEWFKSVALDENNNYHHLEAVREFCKRYFPDLLPKAQEKINKSAKLLEW